MKIINITKTYKTKPIKVLIPVIDIILLLAFGSAFLVDKETGAIILLIALFVSLISYGILSAYLFNMLINGGPIMRADVIGDFPLDTPAEEGADDQEHDNFDEEDDK